jgi:hypothetical protein
MLQNIFFIVIKNRKKKDFPADEVAKCVFVTQ